MKKITALIFAFAILFMGGCSDSITGDSNIIRPPSPTGDKAVIQDVLTETAGGDFVLKYPQNGEYTSAIIMMDITGSGEEDAIALYVPSDSTDGINVSFISEVDGEWQSIGDFTLSADSIDRVAFADVNNDGIEEILIGTARTNSTLNGLTAYTYEKGVMREMVIDETYNSLCVADLTGDGGDDIILLSLAVNDEAASAKLLQYSENEMRPISMAFVEMDSDIIKYTNVKSGYLSDGVCAVFVDGEKNGGVYTTEVIYYSEDSATLLNPLYSSGQDNINQTTRNSVDDTAIVSQDIDNDGCTEIPVITEMPAQTDEDASCVASLISWKELSSTDGILTSKLNTVYNSTGSYYFAIPDRWSGNITARTESGSLIFYFWLDQKSSMGDRLLTISVFDSEDWESGSHDGFIKISESGDKVYAADIAETAVEAADGSAMQISKSEVTDGLLLAASS